MHITQHCIVQAGGLTKQIPCGAASAHAAAALSQAVDCSRRTPRTFRPYSKHCVVRVCPQPSKGCAAQLRRSQRGQLCVRNCEPHSYHERPHTYANNPPTPGLRLALGNEAALKSGQGQQPDYPKALDALYFMYAFTCLVERAWRFGLPLVLVDIPGGFQTVALVGFIAPLAVTLLGPATGQLLDHSPRQLALNTCAMVQGVCIVISGLVMWRAVQLGPSFHLQHSPLFLVLLVFTMLERLTSFASDVAIERDWLTKLVGRGNETALAEANAALRRMDQVAELLGTLAFGWCITHHGNLVVLPVITGLAFLALPFEIWAIQRVVNCAADALTTDRAAAIAARLSLNAQSASEHKGISLSSILKRLGKSAQKTVSSWQLYFQQPVLPASLAFIMLHFNAVLSPGCLMTAFLSSRGLSGTAAAVFRAACAVMGFVGTWVGQALIGSIGLLRTGVCALLLQAGSLALAALIYRSHLAQAHIHQAGATAASALGQAIAGVPLYTWFFCGMIVLSRVAFWVYDMVDAQIFQTAVDPAVVSSGETRLF
ncbi:hypothetical protein WJX82_000311 [Trebouxia sp. C0006]